MKHLVWAAVTAAAFLLGLALGRSQLAVDPSPDAVDDRPPSQRYQTDVAAGSSPGAVVGPGAVAGTAPSRRVPRGDGGLTPEDLAATLERLDRLARGGDRPAAAALRQQLLERILAEAAAGRMATARAMLDGYRQYDPYDPEGLLLESDLRQMQGRGLAALEPLLELLQHSDDADAVTRAREKLALLVGVHETQLANRRDFAGLIRFFEDLAARDPSHDGHRLRLARWLLQGGRAADAERLLAQTGLVGVDPQAHADLLADVRLARSGLPIEHGDNALHVRASVGGRPLRLLVDTGATTTVIGRDRAVALDAVATGERVLVRTAAGVVEAELHRIHDLEVGALQVDALTVLVLDQRLPEGIDGLLGMDVIARFGGAARAGLPFAPEPR